MQTLISNADAMHLLSERCIDDLCVDQEHALMQSAKVYLQLDTYVTCYKQHDYILCSPQALLVCLARGQHPTCCMPSSGGRIRHQDAAYTKLLETA
jgi:hypothetical protein